MSSNIALNYLNIFFYFKIANYLLVVNKAKEYRLLNNRQANVENTNLYGIFSVLHHQAWVEVFLSTIPASQTLR